MGMVQMSGSFPPGTLANIHRDEENIVDGVVARFTNLWEFDHVWYP